MRNKKAFFNEQCLIIEENQMGKTRDLFRRIGKIKDLNVEEGFED